MKVIDDKRSEHGQQRRRDRFGRLLHCCCVCGTVGPWTDEWSWYGSWKELDDGSCLPKFCSKTCSNKGGGSAENVTHEMKTATREREWREPNIVFRDATDKEKYEAAARTQQHKLWK